MSKLPPPPVVGRGQTRDAAARDSADSIAEAAARLPSSVTDLPDEWLLDAEAAPAIPIPSPMSTSTPTADAPREADLFALPDFGEAPADPLAIPVAPTDSRPDPLSVPVADPLAQVVEAEPIEEADVELEAAVIPAPKISAATEVAIESPAVVRDAPPPLVLSPRAPMKQQRRNALIGAGIIGAVLLTMVIVRCSGDGPASSTGNGIAIAPAQAASGEGASGSKAGGAASAGGANEAAGGDAAGGSTRGSADGAAAGGSAAGDAADDDDAAGGDSAAASGGGDKAANSAASGGADERAADADAAGSGTPPTEDSAAAANADSAAAGSDDVVVDNAEPASSSASSSSSKKPTPRTDSAATSGTQNTADAGMTAEEALAKARAAWKAGNAKDTYKYANKSRFKEPSPEATELATLAACKMKLDDAAKTSYKQLDGDRKRKTRLACRDMGVRVGL